MTGQGPAPAASGNPVRHGGRWRAVVAVVLVVFGSLLATVSTVGVWARVALTDTDAFVATLSPLASDPQVQEWLVDQTVQAIDNRLDLASTVDDIIDGLSEAANGRLTRAALELLREPAIEGIRSVLRRATERVITSDAFAATWAQVLRTSHRQAIAALDGEPDALLSLHPEGLGLQLGPVVEAVKQALVDSGFTLAARIPAVTLTVPLVASDRLTQVQTAYRLVVGLTAWLPLLAAAILLGGVLVARRRLRTIAWAALGVGVGAALVLVALNAGGAAAVAAVPQQAMPAKLVDHLLRTTTDGLSDLATVVLTAAITVAVIAGVLSSRMVHAAAGASISALRRGRARIGLDTGRFGRPLWTGRHWIRAVVVALALWWGWSSRPLEAPEVLGIVATTLLVLLLLAVLAQPDEAKDVPPTS